MIKLFNQESVLEHQLSNTKKEISIIQVLINKYKSVEQIDASIEKKRAEKVIAEKRLADDQAILSREAENQAAIKKRVLSEQSLKILSTSSTAVEFLSKYTEAVRFLIHFPETLPTLIQSSEAQRILRDDAALMQSLPLTYRLRFTDAFELGRYAQSGSALSPIRWRVIHRWPDRVLAVSEYCISYMRMCEIAFVYFWEGSELRKWLNYSFYEEAFSAEEQKLILSVSNPNPHNRESNSQGGKNTIDNVFLLSIDEAQSYFHSDADRVARLTMNGFRMRKYTSGPNEPVDWWLRSPGKPMDGTTLAEGPAKVAAHGYVYPDGEGADMECGVRPAIYIKLS